MNKALLPAPLSSGAFRHYLEFCESGGFDSQNTWFMLAW